MALCGDFCAGMVYVHKCGKVGWSVCCATGRAAVLLTVGVKGAELVLLIRVCSHATGNESMVCIYVWVWHA